MLGKALAEGFWFDLIVDDYDRITVSVAEAGVALQWRHYKMHALELHYAAAATDPQLTQPNLQQLTQPPLRICKWIPVISF